ncbi:MAG: inositol monophosphatase [Bacteroidetes bacterium]|jgi:myo-inositol-1(or 4)-monophosphatase|nr:MAG: inositol monophosphatase [Bacteroidota bacterium]
MFDELFIQKLHSIIRHAGNFILKESKHFDKNKIQHKNTYDLVSYVDIQTEKYLIEQLSTLLPEAGFLTEETHHHSQKEWLWIIDPLDGTTNFTRQLPSFAISVALAYQHQIQLGIVYNIPTNELFFAIKNQGAFLNNKRIFVANNPTLTSSLIATGFSVSRFDKVHAHLSIVEHIITHSLGIRRMGAAATDLCYVACGKFDGFFEWYLNPWDVAAGALIANEAGAITSDFSGNGNYLYGKEIITAQPLIYHELLSIIQKHIS